MEKKNRSKSGESLVHLFDVYSPDQTLIWMTYAPDEQSVRINYGNTPDCKYQACELKIVQITERRIPLSRAQKRIKQWIEVFDVKPILNI